MINFYTDCIDDCIKITALTPALLEQWLMTQTATLQRWVLACNFSAKPGQLCLVADAEGQLQQVLLGVKSADDFWAFGALPKALPKNNYRIDNTEQFFTVEQYRRAAMAWGLGAYQFNRYVSRDDAIGRCLFTDKTERDYLQQLLGVLYFVRDLINTPAGDMGPVQLTEVAKKVASDYKAKITVIKGDALLKQNFPTIYAVGKGAEQEPCLIDMTWGDAKAPKVTLVGKGVCFDTGGLNIKPSASMREMKKDMAGAAHVLGLAQLIMWAKLPVRLRVLIPAVENSVDAKSYHPGDIIKTRAGVSVEVDNTDAEGRLILCDALAEAASEEPAYLFDFATLTGAASVALGPEISAMFCNNDAFAEEVLRSSQRVLDPLWRLPLHTPYRDYLKSEMADMLNSSKVPMAGSITAALYLQTFVPEQTRWMHLDFYAANFEAKPGRPVGGEVMTIRAVFDFLRRKFK